jgi:flagella basal body P-ring formation protein FlgA
MKHYLLSLFLIASNILFAHDDLEKNKTQKEKIEESIERIFSSISPEKIIDMIIANEKSELVKTILINYQKKKKR